MDLSELQFFRWEHHGAVATVTFDRPEKRNGLDRAVMTELEWLLQLVRDEPGIKVLILDGAGPAFCAGADISAIRDAVDDKGRARARDDLNQVPRMIGRIYDMLLHTDVISIAAVHGYAIGGGWSLIAGFDHVVAAEGTWFWLPEVELGMPFRGLANVALTNRLGPALAREAMLLGRRFTGEELAAYRVINAVVPAGDLVAETQRVTEAYLDLPWRAVLSTRRDINAAIYGPQHY